MIRSVLLAALLLSGLSFADEPKWKMKGMEVEASAPVAFQTGSAKLTTEGEAALADIKSYLDDKTYVTTMRVEGHVQSGAKDAQKLSEQRALAAAKWLVSKGIGCKRLIAVGFGANKPVSATPAENNRLTFVNAALRGHAIGGAPLDGSGQVAGELCK